MRKSELRFVLLGFATIHAAILLFLPLRRLVIWSLAPDHPSLTHFGHGYVPGDIELFLRLASQSLAGAVPYRDYPVEYPILAFPLFLLPRLITSRADVYAVLFGVEMLLCDLLAMSLVARWVAAREGRVLVVKRLWWYTGFACALLFLVSSRYDFAPTAVAFAAAVAWFSGRGVLGGTAAAVGTLLKVFPACVVGPGVVQELSQIRATRLRGTLAFTLTIAIGGGLWWALGAEQTVKLHLGRGLHIETVWAGILMAAGKATGAEMRVVSDRGSAILLAPGVQPLLALLFPIQAIALLLVLWRFWRTGLHNPLRYAGALVLTFVLTGKGFSPQYLIWLIPFVTVLAGRSGDFARGVFLLSCLMTTFLFHWAYPRLSPFDPWMIGLLNVRNASMIGLLGVWLFGPEGDSGQVGEVA